MNRVREPAVAGLFYPEDPEELAQTIDDLLNEVALEPVSHLRGLVCPHAGYRYSGPVAACAYRQLERTKPRRVLILAPSHYAWFEGAAVCTAQTFRTPLGAVPISALGRTLAGQPPFVPEASCSVQRPGWWRDSSRVLAARAEETPHTWEHADEVQVPFLQRVLKDFEVLPIVFGEVDPRQAAGVLEPHVDDETLLVASSDLSHFHSYEEAGRLDSQCARAVCALDLDAVARQEACGRGPVLTLMHVARARGWQAQLLDYRNSGDTSGDRSRVVGYAAIAFYERKIGGLDESARHRLLELARRTIRAVIAHGALPEVAASEWSGATAERRACFVTLTRDGQLRGCIGHLQPQAPLYQAVMENAHHAALKDPRFDPVRASELDQLAIEISVLSETRPLAFRSERELLAQLRPHRDGVILSVGGRTATFLPQVWAQLTDKVAFLNSLCRKAGLDAEAWRRSGATVSVYEADVFHEPERRGGKR